MIDRDLVEHLQKRLETDDRRLLQMYYADGLTFAEIGMVLGVTESTVCLRHTALMRELRRYVGVGS